MSLATIDGQQQLRKCLLFCLFLTIWTRMAVKIRCSIALAVTMVQMGKSLWAAHIRTCGLPTAEISHADEISKTEVRCRRSCFFGIDRSAIGARSLFTCWPIASQLGYLFLIWLNHAVELGDALVWVLGNDRTLWDRPFERINLPVEFVNQLLLVHGETRRN